MSEYADYLERWATTEGLGIEPRECLEDGSDCGSTLCPPVDEQEWSPDQWQYWCRGKRTAVELLRIWEALP